MSDFKQASASPAWEGSQGGAVGPRQDDTGDRPTTTDAVHTSRRFQTSTDMRLATLEREMRSISGDPVALEEHVRVLRKLVREAGL